VKKYGIWSIELLEPQKLQEGCGLARYKCRSGEIFTTGKRYKKI
jgi:hypothetical protein